MLLFVYGAVLLVIMVGAIWVIAIVAFLVWGQLVFMFTVAAVRSAVQALDALLPAADKALRGLSADFSRLSPQEQQELMGTLVKIGGQWNQLNAAGRRRYSARVEQIQSLAASNGIDWKPGR